jgi:hypothetical protein
MWKTRLLNEGNTKDDMCVENFKIVRLSILEVYIQK